MMLEKAEEQWRVKHGARFETTKYVLVHYTRRRIAETTTPIEINGALIPQYGRAPKIDEFRVKGRCNNNVPT